MNQFEMQDAFLPPQAKKNSVLQVEAFMDAALLLGAEFLSCGGPVTRLEAQLSAAGARSGYETTVHATPSAITVFCQLRNEHISHSRGRRIQSFGVDLGRLKSTDRLLSRFARGDIRANHVVLRLTGIKDRMRPPSAVTRFLCIFGIGAGAALLSGASFVQIAECGLFSLCVQLVVALIGRFFNMSAVFSDFVACFIAFAFATVAQRFFEAPAQLLTLGTLVYIVPGLLMTTAISEIVDQNYLSGSIRLLKALCTFLAMALAYFLALDLGRVLGLTAPLLPASEPSLPQLLPRMMGSAFIIFCAAIEFRAHKNSFVGILACGLSGAFCYFLTQSTGSLVAPHFIAAFVIGLVSYVLSRRYNHPSQIYSVPSILVLAPGMLAFSSFGYGAAENLNLPSIVRAALVSLSIVFGLAASRLPFVGHLISAAGDGSTGEA